MRLLPSFHALLASTAALLIFACPVVIAYAGLYRFGTALLSWTEKGVVMRGFAGFAFGLLNAYAGIIYAAARFANHFLGKALANKETLRRGPFDTRGTFGWRYRSMAALFPAVISLGLSLRLRPEGAFEITAFGLGTGLAYAFSAEIFSRADGGKTRPIGVFLILNTVSLPLGLYWATQDILFLLSFLGGLGTGWGAAQIFLLFQRAARPGRA